LFLYLYYLYLSSFKRNTLNTDLITRKLLQCSARQ